MHLNLKSAVQQILSSSTRRFFPCHIFWFCRLMVSSARLNAAPVWINSLLFTEKLFGHRARALGRLTGSDGPRFHGEQHSSVLGSRVSCGWKGLRSFLEEQ